jgi:hypothetical protein
VSRDDAEAAHWYRAAADKGHAEAINNLGAFYEHGRGVKKDVGQAAALYRKAAGQGDAAAQYNLALLLESGQREPGHQAEVAGLLEQAAQADYAPALFRLAELAATDTGGPAGDTAKVVGLYYRAGVAFLHGGKTGEARRCLAEIERLEAHAGTSADGYAAKLRGALGPAS